jgi:hypothetical protein
VALSRHSGPFLDANPFRGDPKLVEQPRHVFDECRRTADEAERRRVVHERREVGPADASARALPAVCGLARDRQTQLDLAVTRHRPELLLERELERRPRAVEKSDVAVRQMQRMAKHRAKRRDPGASGDEHEAPLARRRRERESPDRAFDVDNGAGRELEMRPRAPFGVDADEKLENTIPRDILWRRSNGVGFTALVAAAAHEDGLAGKVRERLAVEIDADDPRARRGGQDFADRQRQHGRICYLSEMSLLRRTRGALLRLVRRRRLTTAIGLAMALPAAYVQFSGRFPGWIEGASLIVGATGIALAWTGLTGVSPDWVEESE